MVSEGIKELKVSSPQPIILVNPQVLHNYKIIFPGLHFILDSEL